MSVNSTLSYFKYHTWPSQIKAEEWETELLFTDLDYFWKLHYMKIVNIGFILILLKSGTNKYFYGCTKRSQIFRQFSFLFLLFLKQSSIYVNSILGKVKQ